MKYTFSVVIPAHNEEQYIGKCLEAVEAAAKAVLPCTTEIIVVTNRCTDRTDEIARKCGFNSSNYFKDCFHRATGQSPTGFRLQGGKK